MPHDPLKDNRDPLVKAMERGARRQYVLGINARLRGIHTALDDALGDTYIEHMDDDELRDAHPVPWAAQRLAEVIEELEA